jgi:hypothetical protein
MTSKTSYLSSRLPLRHNLFVIRFYILSLCVKYFWTCYYIVCFLFQCINGNLLRPWWVLTTSVVPLTTTSWKALVLPTAVCHHEHPPPPPPVATVSNICNIQVMLVTSQSVMRLVLLLLLVAAELHEPREREILQDVGDSSIESTAAFYFSVDFKQIFYFSPNWSLKYNSKYNGANRQEIIVWFLFIKE